MADPTEVDELDDEGQAPARKNWRKELEAQAKAAEARAAELERKLALSEAGLTGLKPKQVTALLAAHGEDSPITSEAFKATAAELGFAGTVAETEPDVDPEQAQRDAEVSELNRFAGASQPSGSSVMSQEEITAKINSFDSPEAIKEFVLANADLFPSGA